MLLSFVNTLTEDEHLVKLEYNKLKIKFGGFLQNYVVILLSLASSRLWFENV